MGIFDWLKPKNTKKIISTQQESGTDIMSNPQEQKTEEELILEEVEKIKGVNELWDFVDNLVNDAKARKVMYDTKLCRALFEKMMQYNVAVTNFEINERLGLDQYASVKSAEVVLYDLGSDFIRNFFISILREDVDKNVVKLFFAQYYKCAPELLDDEIFLNLITKDNFDKYRQALTNYCENKSGKIPKALAEKINELLEDEEMYEKFNGLAILQGKASGLNVRKMEPHEAKRLSDKVDNRYKMQQAQGEEYTDRPAMDQLMLVRITDVFPTNNKITTASNSNATLRYRLDGNVDTPNNWLWHNDREEIAIDYAKAHNIEGINSFNQLREYLEINNPQEWDEVSQDIEQRIKENYSIRYKMKRDSIHFTMNCLVTANDGGDWSNMPFIIMEPYAEHVGKGEDVSNPNNFENVGGFDSWTKGSDFELKKPTILIRETELITLMKKAKTDERIMATLQNSEIVIMETNQQVKDYHYVRALLEEKGCPAYYCSDKYIKAFNGATINPGMSLTLLEEGDRLGIKSGVLHSNHVSYFDENRQNGLSMRESLYKFMKYIAKYVNIQENELQQFSDYNKEAEINRMEEFIVAKIQEANLSSNQIKKIIKNYNKMFIEELKQSTQLEQSVIISLGQTANDVENIGEQSQNMITEDRKV